MMTALITTDQIRALQASRRKAGISDDDWRARLGARYGVESTTKLTVVQANAELDSLNGSAPQRRSNGRLKLAGPYATKLQALWIAAYNLGIVRDRDDAALIAFVKRQTGIDHPRFLVDDIDANKAIEALKGWLHRDGGVDWSNNRHDPNYMRKPQYKIATAQVRIIGSMRPIGRFSGVICSIIPKPLPDIFDDEWITVMNRLGSEIRDLKGE